VPNLVKLLLFNSDLASSILSGRGKSSATRYGTPSSDANRGSKSPGVKDRRRRGVCCIRIRYYDSGNISDACYFKIIERYVERTFQVSQWPTTYIFGLKYRSGANILQQWIPLRVWMRKVFPILVQAPIDSQASWRRA
jgi:hypothetical protein